MILEQNTFQKLRIACLSYQGLSGYGLEPTLEYMFPLAEIVTVYPQHLRSFTLKNYDLLVMPGIIGEDSPYPEIFPQQKAEQIVRAMEETGLVLWTSCAATYYLFEKMVYLRRNGQFKRLNGLGLISGYAEGPAYSNITRTDFTRSAYADRVLAEIASADSNQIFRALDINGPALYPKAESLVDSFLRYSDIHDKPVAGFTKKIGQGLLLGLSSHPEMSLNHNLLPANFAKHEPSRLEFLKHIADKITTHWAGMGKISRPNTPIILRGAHA